MYSQQSLVAAKYCGSNLIVCVRCFTATAACLLIVAIRTKGVRYTSMYDVVRIEGVTRDRGSSGESYSDAAVRVCDVDALPRQAAHHPPHDVLRRLVGFHKKRSTDHNLRPIEPSSGEDQA